MALRINRLKGSDAEPHTLEVQSFLGAASSLLLHIERTPGVTVLAKKSWALTDDFEAYFSYKGRLFLMWTPFSLAWISLLGQPEDSELFAEIETRVQSYSWPSTLLAPIAILRYVAVRFTPSRAQFRQFGVPFPGEATSNAP
jgi:hypothetical protein